MPELHASQPSGVQELAYGASESWLINVQEICGPSVQLPIAWDRAMMGGFTLWELASAINQGSFFPLLRELVYQHTADQNTM